MKIYQALTLYLALDEAWRNYGRSYLHMSLLGLPVLNMLSQVVADGSEGGVDLHTEVAPVADGSLIGGAIHL